MSKEQKSGREEKKKPQMTSREKHTVKRQKKQTMLHVSDMKK